MASTQPKVWLITGASLGIGYYGASKHALEGLIKALSKEVFPEWNIKFKIIECGAFRTRIISSVSYDMLPNHPAYQGGPSEILKNYLLNIDKMPAAGDPDKAVVSIYEVANAETRRSASRWA
ncbi:hypothetical protein CPB85DRAFT_1562107 [Mucidula mucida]|nr:hypothetical protein CPB85DRAFT_1562107 [Mucidula mucida]